MQDSKRSFTRIAIVAIIANLVLTYAHSYEGDQGYWMGWIEQLQKTGFAGFTGNYPPIYVHWLWAVGKLFTWLDIPVQQGFALKFLCLWPVYFGHLFFLRTLFVLVEKRSWPSGIKQAILWACALNPALLLDGPAWGQVDLLPTLFVVWSLLACFSRRFRLWSIPLFVASLLIKFQMIAFLPVLGALYLRNYKKHWNGALISVGVILVVLAPFLIGGSAGVLLQQAYGKAAGTYPYATYNAANLWMLLVGNVIDVNTIPFIHQIERSQYPLALFTCGMLGKILFTLVALGVFIAALRSRSLRQAAMLSTLMGLSFFFLLPEMHERYLFPAVPIVLLWLATNWKAWPWALFVTLLTAANIAMINGVQGEQLWMPLSIFATVAFVLLLLRALLPKIWNRALAHSERIPCPTGLPEAVLVACLLFCMVTEILPMRPERLRLQANQAWVDTLQVLDKSQEYREFQFGKSVDENTLRIGNAQYRNGIGTHAPSRITFQLPKDAQRFQAKVGLDQETSDGRLMFVVLLNDVEIWHSRPMTQKDKPVDIDLDIAHGGRISLVTDPLGDKSFDHADWVYARITKGATPVSTDSMDLMTLTPVFNQQSYGELRAGSSVDQNPLIVDGRIYKSGLGTHASSRALYKVPAGACGLDFKAGIDAEVGSNGGVIFAVSRDGQRVWHSDTVFGGKPPVVGYVNLKGAQNFQLEVDSLKNNAFDHADWLDTKFRTANCQ